MSASMLGQVVAAHEAPIAHVTHKLLLTGVCSPVAGELVGAGKLLVTALPVAAEWFLTSVSSEMSLEVGTFEVGLLTAGEIADVVPPAGEVCLCGIAALP